MLAAEVCSSPLCHRPKSRLHRRSIGVPNRSAPCPLRPAQTPAERPSSEASLSAVVRMRKAWQYQCSMEVRAVVCFAEGLLPATAHNTTERRCGACGKRLCMRSLLHLVDTNHLIAVCGNPVAQTTVEQRNALSEFTLQWALPRCAKRGWPTTPKTTPFRNDTTHCRAVPQERRCGPGLCGYPWRVGMVTGAHC